MDVKNELAGRISKLVGDETGPMPEQILELLSGYSVGYSIGPEICESMDYPAQVDYYLTAKKSEGLSDKVLVYYRRFLVLFGEFTGKRTDEVTADDIRGYVSHLSNIKHYQNSTIQTAFSALRGFFNWLEGEEIIDRNLIRSIKSLKLGGVNTRHPLTPDQTELLRAACETSLEKALVEFLYSTGCRVSEAEQINVDDVDFDDRRVSVIGKGNKRRTLFFSVRAKVLLKNYLADRIGGDMALFCNTQQPYLRMRYYTIQKHIRRLGARAGIGDHLHPHILRHTLASDLLNAGMDIKIIQKIMGHASVTTTEIYAELNEDTVGREYDKYLS